MLTRAVKVIANGIISNAYPEHCRLCLNPIESIDDGIACHLCWLDPRITEMIGRARCEKCGAPMSDCAEGAGARLCGLCDQFPFSAARSCGIYSGAIEASVLELKSRPRICRRLREIITGVWAAEGAALAADAIMPVPLHRSRQRERGYNQASLIARAVARASGLPALEGSIIRARPTDLHRAGFDAKDRARSVGRAFSVVRPADFAGRSILVVDDVFTTGSTLSAISRSLLDAGAARVTVITIARVAPRQARRL